MARSNVNFGDFADYLSLDFGNFSLEPLPDHTSSSRDEQHEDGQGDSHKWPGRSHSEGSLQSAAHTRFSSDTVQGDGGLSSSPESQAAFTAPPPYETTEEDDEHDAEYLHALALSRETIKEDEQRRQQRRRQTEDRTQNKQFATSSRHKGGREGGITRTGTLTHTTDESRDYQTIAQYDFQPQRKNEIELRKGELITKARLIDDDWMKGDNTHGQRGLFPKSVAGPLVRVVPAARKSPMSGSKTVEHDDDRHNLSPDAKNRRDPQRSFTMASPPPVPKPGTVQVNRFHSHEILRKPLPEMPKPLQVPRRREMPRITVEQADAIGTRRTNRDSLYSITSNEESAQSPRTALDPLEPLLSASPSTRPGSMSSLASNEESVISPLSLQLPAVGRERSATKTLTQLKIRDTSRSRTGARDGSAVGNSEQHACYMCRQHGLDRWYCDRCDVVFCKSCWKKQPLHSPRSDDEAPDSHEKTDVRLANKIKAIFSPKLTAGAREQLHTKDIETTWFGVVREDDGSLPLFRDYGRYAELIAMLKERRSELPPLSGTSADESDILYPGLVSFVGQTGAGKSTLIKLLIDLGTKLNDPDFLTPVVGETGANHPTSEDVHLYLDPASSMSPGSHAPLLFADCEGLRGGERDPAGALLRKKHERLAQYEKGKLGHRQTILKHTSERELLWATSSNKKARSFAVANLYPRLLYTFSDVIVFVEQNQRTLEEVLQRLVEWADAALEKSSNQPVLPHAIIALNQSRYDIKSELWDVDSATDTHLDSVSLDLKNHPVFKQQVEFWNDRGREINTVGQLVRSYYSSIRVVHVPAEGKPNLILQQTQKLYDEIHQASQSAREQKAGLRMLLGADDFQPYLEQAFDHFARDLNMPFDFVQASMASSPIPHDFGGNILKLAIQIMACWEDKAKGHTIFEELSNVVASSIMLDAARCGIKGRPEEIFSSRYLEHIDNALENFCNLHWPCEYRDERRGRCVNVRSGHATKGHQLKDGRMLSADGHYESDFEFESYRDTFQKHVYSKLIALEKMVQERTKELGIEEKFAAAEVHRDRVLPTFIERASHNNPKAFISHTVCFVCLFEPPEHALPCGHIICTPCLKMYGDPVPNRYVAIARCPMEKPDLHFRDAWRIRLKPAGCGVRVLSLDGGGIRGIVELEILRQIEKEFGGGISVQSFFDLIVGTSTGGIIALGLTAGNLPLGECTRQFEAFCKQAFTLRKGAGMPIVGRLVENYNHSKYETKPLQDALISAFTNDQYLFGGERRAAGSLDIKVAVTTTSAAGTSIVLANYNRLCLEKLPYHFQRPEQLDGEVKTWEAARATSAAPFYFKPLHHEPSKQVFSDGGLYHNNPIKIADQERRFIWPDQQDAEPDIVVSIGTAFCPKSEKDVDKSTMRWRPESKGILAHLIFVANLGKDHIYSSLRSEKTWTEFIGNKSSQSKERYVRINPALDKPPPKLDDVSQLEYLRSTTEIFARFTNYSQVQEVIRRLVATCFYFELEERSTRESNSNLFEITGNLRCRFTESHEIEALGKYIRRHAVRGFDPHFVIKESDNDHVNHEPVLLSKRVVDRMLNDNRFGLSRKLTIQRSNQQAVTEIFLHLTHDKRYPISGFPRQLKNRQHGFSTNRTAVHASESWRWKGRSASFRDRRSEWKPSPDWSSAEYREAQDSIERYAESTYLLGLAKEDDLMPTGPGTYGPTAPLSLLSRSSTLSLAPESHRQSNLRRSKTHSGLGEAAQSPAPCFTEATGSYSNVAGLEEPEPSSGPSLKRRSTIASVIEVQEARYFIARNDWQAHSDNELSLKQFDIVRITKMARGWWLGHRSPSDREGWMPSNFLIPAGPHAPEAFVQQHPRMTVDVAMGIDPGPSQDLESVHRDRSQPPCQLHPETRLDATDGLQEQFSTLLTKPPAAPSNISGLRRVAQNIRSKVKNTADRRRAIPRDPPGQAFEASIAAPSAYCSPQVDDGLKHELDSTPMAMPELDATFTERSFQRYELPAVSRSTPEGTDATTISGPNALVTDSVSPPSPLYHAYRPSSMEPRHDERYMYPQLPTVEEAAPMSESRDEDFPTPRHGDAH